MSKGYAERLRVVALGLLGKRGIAKRDILNHSQDAVYRFFGDHVQKLNFDLGIEIMLRLGISIDDIETDLEETPVQAQRREAIAFLSALNDDTLSRFVRWVDEFEDAGRAADALEILDLTVGLSRRDLSLLRLQTEALVSVSDSTSKWPNAKGD